MTLWMIYLLVKMQRILSASSFAAMTMVSKESSCPIVFCDLSMAA